MESLMADDVIEDRSQNRIIPKLPFGPAASELLGNVAGEVMHTPPQLTAW